MFRNCVLDVYKEILGKANKIKNKMTIIIQSLEIIASIFIAMLVSKMLVDIMFYIAKKITK